MQNEIRKEIVLKAPLSRVWQALTDYKQFGEWFRVNLQSPFEPGKPVRGNITYPGYEHVMFEATVIKMEPESLFSYTWHPYAVDANIDYSKETPTLVEFHLSHKDGVTKVEVVESGFENIPEGRRPEAFRMNSGGWEEQMKNIENYVCQSQAK
jgi:uncharacterized protein YndB with AHSA1/START domain